MAIWRKEKTEPTGTFGLIRDVWRQVWRTLGAGLLVWVPLIFTVWLTWFFVDKFVRTVEHLVRAGLTPFRFLAERYEMLAFLNYLNFPFAIGVLIALLLFLGTGILTRLYVGRRIIALGEKIVKVIPVVNRVYGAVQQIRDVFVGRQGAVFQQVCLVEYPRPGMVAMAFITSSEHGLVQEAIGKELVAVFVPTTPNPTSGYLVYLPPDEVQTLDISVEEAMKLIISGGAYIPGQEKDEIEPESRGDAEAAE